MFLTLVGVTKEFMVNAVRFLIEVIVKVRRSSHMPIT
jgi:hypothetical protein